MAARLARILYRMLRYRQAYVDRGQEPYEKKFRLHQVHLLERKAAQLGFQLVAFDDYRLKAGRILWRLRVALRLKTPEGCPG